ncbi:hypothetical protein [Cyanobacterium sp. HL-69]
MSSIKVCRVCQGKGKILVKAEESAYVGVDEYYYKICLHCQGKGVINN